VLGYGVLLCSGNFLNMVGQVWPRTKRCSCHQHCPFVAESPSGQHIDINGTLYLAQCMCGGRHALKPRVLPHLLLCTLHSARSCPSGDPPAPGAPHAGTSTFNDTFRYKVECESVLAMDVLPTCPCLLGVSGSGCSDCRSPKPLSKHAHMTKNLSSQATNHITELGHRRVFSSLYSTHLINCLGNAIRTIVVLGCL
jgi:hypothetical protein